MHLEKLNVLVNLLVKKYFLNILYLVNYKHLEKMSNSLVKIRDCKNC